jgi:predicted ArsR family transcriptional regulator
MGADSNTRVQKLNPNDLLSFARKHEEPVVTASEIAEEFDVTPKAARYRLNQLAEQGRIRGKTVGASAKVWYPVAKEPSVTE